MQDKEQPDNNSQPSVDKATEPEVLTSPVAGPTTPGAPEVPKTDITEQPAPVAPIPMPPPENPTQSLNAAVDEIAAQESPEVPSTPDQITEPTPTDTKKAPRGIKQFLKSLWQNPRRRYLGLAIIGALLAVIVAVPPSRYFALNNIGIRSSALLTVLDDSTQQPLKNVQVKLQGQTGLTDNNGQVRLNHLKLGNTHIVIEKRAFAPLNRDVTLGWGSNPLGDYRIVPVGTQYTFSVVDFISGKPVMKAEASSNDANAVSDDKGKLVLTMEKVDDQDLKVVIKAGNYRDEEFTISPNMKDTREVKLVPSRKHVFISKRSGKYDLYKIDVDGKNEQLLLAGTGSEREDMVVVSHPSDEVVALVSTRDNVRNRDGYLLSSLTIIDVKTGEVSDIGQSERFQLVDWIGSRLVYVQIAAGSSANNPDRHRLNTYDYKNNEKKEVATSNYFNDVMVVGSQIYYAPSSAFKDSGSANLYRIDADNNNRQTVLDKEVWNIFRTEYDKLSLSVGQDWYEYKVGDAKTTKAKGPPAVLRTRIYADSPDRSQSLWVDERDGKGVLLTYNLGDKSDKTVRSQSGLKNPVRWLNNRYIIYRINTDQETADYVLNLDGGEPLKVRDVTNTGGVDRWYYY